MEAMTISLGDLLEKRFDAKLGPMEVTKIHVLGWHISKALNYLHNEALIIHGDMKSFNILIKGDFVVCKLCDFGVSIHIKKDGNVDLDKYPAAHYTGTDLWSAPEVFEEDPSLVTVKSEIFSFGLVLYETLALSPPHTLEITDAKKALNFDDEENEGEEAVSDEEDDEPMVGTRPFFPNDFWSKISEDHYDVVHLFHSCTEDDPEDRPTAEKLEKIFEELNIIVID